MTCQCSYCGVAMDVEDQEIYGGDTVLCGSAECATKHRAKIEAARKLPRVEDLEHQALHYGPLSLITHLRTV